MCRDTINLIIHNLARKELYYLSLTSTFYHELIQFKKLILNTIHKRLQYELGDNFINIMHRNKAFISGSFIIQCVLDEYWSNSTIDIYVPYIENDFNELENYLSNELYIENHLMHTYHCNTQIFSFLKNLYKDIINVRDFTPWCHNEYCDDDDEDHYHNFVIGYHNTTKLNVQIISLNIPKDDLSYYRFVQTFKFNMCMYCDDKLYINNIEDILNENY